MARTMRFHRPGAFYHVMLRGNDGQKIFFCDADRCKMSLLIHEGVERYGHRIHAFCFMNNHIHLLVQVGKTPLSKIIHNLSFRYCQWINKKQKKIGHLFQGRFKAILLQEEAYFLRLLRYIHLNPVRAKLVRRPEQYSWSGHNVYLGQKEVIWTTTVTGLSKFASTREEARIRYIAYMKADESENELDELRRGFKQGHILGDDDFLKKTHDQFEMTQEHSISIRDCIEAVLQVFGINEKLLTSSVRSRQPSLARAAVAMLANEEAKITLEDVAKVLNRDSSTICSLLDRFRKKCTQDAKLNNLVVKLQNCRPDPRNLWS